MKRGFFIYMLAFTLFSCEPTISEFQSENYLKLFGSGYECRGSDVIELADGSCVLTGYDRQENDDEQILLVKVDENGNQIWFNNYGNTEIDDQGVVVREVSDGLLAVGISDSAGIARPFILKAGANGDSLWYKTFGSQDTDIMVEDVALDETSMYVAGYAIQPGNSLTSRYSARLSLDGELMWQYFYTLNSNSSFRRVYLRENHVLLLGDDGQEDKISMVIADKSSGVPADEKKLDAVGETLADAMLTGEALFILANGASGMLLYKLSLSFDVVWETEPIDAITGKTMALQGNGSMILLGEDVFEGASRINPVEVSESGVTAYGSEEFRTIPGTVSRMRPANNNCLIMIGSTNATFGTNAQLIKTGADLFLLKP